MLTYWSVDCVLQQTGNYYDLTAYPGIPSTIATGRDQAAALATAPFTGERPSFFMCAGNKCFNILTRHVYPYDFDLVAMILHTQLGC